MSSSDSRVWTTEAPLALDTDTDIVYARVWCPHQPDSYGDRMGVEELTKAQARFKADMAAGKVCEMGVNHEGAPTELLRALALEIATEPIQVDGDEVFHEGDWILKAQLFGERLKAFRDGRMTGVSMELVSVPTKEDKPLSRDELEELRGEVEKLKAAQAQPFLPYVHPIQYAPWVVTNTTTSPQLTTTGGWVTGGGVTK